MFENTPSYPEPCTALHPFIPRTRYRPTPLHGTMYRPTPLHGTMYRPTPLHGTMNRPTLDRALPLPSA